MAALQIDEALLDAALRTFKRFGYQRATLERIAAEAGLSRVTLHRRRVSKDAILDALAERSIESYRAAMWPALTAAGTGAERMRTALLALCDSAEANLELLVAMRARTDAVFHEDEPSNALTRSVFTEPLERILRDGSADGSLRGFANFAEAATVLFNLAGWTYVHLRTGHHWGVRRARSATVDFALSSVLARAS